MTIHKLLKGPSWTCQWRYPFMGEVNRTRKQVCPRGSSPLMTCYRT